ncbi:MAG: antibiotic biosynthesis monooxygenase [Plectolyngbya sp. WJT66-NPBG17]|jgi:quinol monooxygenase YgiN|nr:antibiotic biosynthesis monooxygenase [Plectolyngbya sp. WJT66-NPBG17]MBW4528973.1 antibiotic biosynthesis monooxygenase [Phormidium tanganyikae FI6-MK23]
MKNLKVRILTQLTAHPEREQELKNALVQFMQERCQQVGCHNCELLHHLTNAAQFILVEEWDAEARIKSELDSQLFARLGEAAAELFIEPLQIHWYDVITSQSCAD